jgi:hypothetical protein
MNRCPQIVFTTKWKLDVVTGMLDTDDKKIITDNMKQCGTNGGPWSHLP